MKLCVKKIYCSNCRRAVTAAEPPAGPPYRVLCSKCGMTICVSNGIYWRRGVPGETAPAREPAVVTPAAATPRKLKAPPPRSRPPARPAGGGGRPLDRAPRPAAGEARPQQRPKPAADVGAQRKPAGAPPASA